ncbi:MAG: DUF1553 domain-containing protein [Rubripirellula sp.]
MNRIGLTAILIALLLLGSSSGGEEPTTVDFETQIAPIFQQHCVRCHSSGINKGEISLATIADLQENEYVVAGKPEESYLLDLITPQNDAPPEMPLEGAPLSNEQVELVRRWIAEGAQWPEDIVVRELPKADSTWWSLQPLQASPDANIDEFIQHQLEVSELSMNPIADRRTLIRRATFDLHGLPPTPSEVEAFVNDPDSRAFEKLVDRLLASPHYGERWGRHWLDVVRFGESIGYERNVLVNDLWPFRDYVIESINQDKPFNQFIREHIAGDVFAPEQPEVAVGSAFLVAGPYDDVGNQDAAQAAQIRANTLDEIINATGQAFLGMTIGCARCHDHKFDPITQHDYYAMYATFAGVRHGSVELSSAKSKMQRAAKLQPLNEQKAALEKQQAELRTQILTRAKERLNEYESKWTRPAVDRTGTKERFDPVKAKFIRLVFEAQDINANSASGIGIDEFEVWSHEPQPRNVALAANGGVASGASRKIEDFPGAYGPQLAIDGKTGERFVSRGSALTVEFAKPILIDHVVFSSAKGEPTPEHRKFVFVAEYRLEISNDGTTWTEVASGRDRKPVNQSAHLERRLLLLETTQEELVVQQRTAKDLRDVKRKITAVPKPKSVWIGRRVPEDAKGPFHVFVGGSPAKKGGLVVPVSLSAFDDQPLENYKLDNEAPESERRLALADWIVNPDNPLTLRVLANRLWHYHFGTGIVDTPSDFGYMGGRPSHPELLDFLAKTLKDNDWKIKPLHRLIMNSRAYQQSSKFHEHAAKIDGDARSLWRFPPRRLSAEEVRDTILQVCGKLDTRSGGPGFRLYHFMQDNVCTFAPLDQHGPETYRRAVYHQNARASVVDLMTEFDQPDCTFSAPRRAQTTSPLQSLTMLNHSFTLDMASAFAKRIQQHAGDDFQTQLQLAYQLCYSRPPAEEEVETCQAFQQLHGLPALCRVLLNTSELIYVQ